jgi:hypothetical protein
MRRRDLIRKLAQADKDGVWAFTPATFSALLGNIEPKYLKLRMKRLSDQEVLVRAARGVYVNPSARSMPPDVRRALVRYLRPGEVSYVSLESKLSEVGAISQIPTVLTCMTTGSPGQFDTPWGRVEFTHTDRNIEFGSDVYVGDDGVPEASAKRAASDLRRIRRNTGLIDQDILNEVICEESDYGRARNPQHQP